MPELKSTRSWHRFAPALGENREQSKPFLLKVRVGLTKPELAAYSEKLRAVQESSATATEGKSDDTVVDEYVQLLDGLVEMGEEPLVVDGKPITTLRDYLLLCLTVAGYGPLIEVYHSVIYWNSVRGAREVFYARLSGGAATTPAAGAAAPTASR